MNSKPLSPKHLRLLLAAALMLLFMITGSSHAALLPFIDDFNDGNATDGMPGTWLPGNQPGGTRDASSGDMVVTHTSGSSTRLLELDGLRDVSISTQLRISQVSGNRDAAVVWARSTSPGGAYWGGVDTNGLIAIGDTGVGGYLASTSTSLDPVNKDVLLQFDVFGNHLDLTAWQDGAPKPSSPQLSVTDNHLVNGGGLGFSLSPNVNGGSAPASATFRYFAVVPEPASCLLFMSAIAVVCGMRSRVRICKVH